MLYHLYDVYYKENGQPGISHMQGADISSALKLYSLAHPDRFVTMIVYKFSFDA